MTLCAVLCLALQSSWISYRVLVSPILTPNSSLLTVKADLIHIIDTFPQTYIQSTPPTQVRIAAAVRKTPLDPKAALVSALLTLARQAPPLAV